MYKYDLLADMKEVDGVIVRRIRALMDIPEHNVKKGDIGGYVESSFNLSHEGSAWIEKDAVVFEKASIAGSALISDEAIVRGSAHVFENAVVGGKAKIYENARIHGEVEIWENPVIFGGAHLLDNVEVWGNADIAGNVEVRGQSKIYGNALLRGNTVIRDDCTVKGDARVRNAKLSGIIAVKDKANIHGNELVTLHGVMTIANEATIKGNAVLTGSISLYDQCSVDDNAVIDASDGDLTLRGVTRILELVSLKVEKKKTMLDEELTGDLELSFKENE